MSTVSLTTDPSSCLTPPQQGGGAAMAIWSLRVDAGPIIGGVDAAISFVTGFSPLENWVLKPFAGDWDALDKGSIAWKSAGKSAGLLADGIRDFPAQVGDAWQGETADEWRTAHGKVLGSLEELPDQASQLSQMCTAFAEAAKFIASLVASLLRQVAQTATEMLIAAAVPVAGWIGEAPLAAKLVWQAASGSGKVAQAIAKFGQLISKLVPMLQRILKIMNTFAKYAGNLKRLITVSSGILDAASPAH